MITKRDCQYDGTIDLPDGRQVKVSFPQDNCQDAPWENSDGHGPIRVIRSREDKRPGERILGGSRWHFYAYDVRGATKLAKRDGWNFAPETIAKLAASLGHAPSKGEIAAAAVEMDADFLSGWINNDWTYVTVAVRLLDAEGSEISADYLGGVESLGDYYSECAAEMANALIEADDKERAESSYWLDREVVTV